MTKGFRRADNGAEIEGSWARASGLFEVWLNDGMLGFGRDRQFRQLAADIFRSSAQRAEIRPARLCAGYLQTVPGKEAVDEEREKLQQKARRLHNRMSIAIGVAVYSMLLDLLVMDNPLAPDSAPPVAWGLDRIADLLHLELPGT